MPALAESDSASRGKTPRFDYRKVIFVFFIIVLLISVVLSVKYFFLTRNYDPRLTKAYVSVTKVNREEIVSDAANNCKRVNFTDNTETLNYNETLKGYMVSNMDNVDTLKLLFIYDKPPDLSGCTLIWAVDRDGVGFVGYEDVSGNFIFKSGVYPKESVDEIYKSIDSSSLVK